MEPELVNRHEQPYVAIVSNVSMQQLGELLPPLGEEVLAWVTAAGLVRQGPVFWKYNVIDMPRRLEVEVGMGVDRRVEGDHRVRGGVLPGGQYAVAHHVGHPATLERATAELLAWAADQGVSFDVTPVDGEERWAARLEEYLTDPDDEPDMEQWETNLVFRTAQ